MTRSICSILILTSRRYRDAYRNGIRLLLSLFLITAPRLAQAQDQSSAKPATNGVATEISKAGYSLKPTGLATGEWPNLRLDFSIERSDRTNFKNLQLADIQPKIDGKDLQLTEGDLKLRDNEASGVLLLLDGSGSMSNANIDKLSAAKEALKTLIDNLGSGDRVALVVFDEEPRLLLPATTDKDAVKREIDNFTIRKDKSRYTMLYDAVDFALQQAQQNKIKNVLLISDGWEDTPDSRKLLATPEQLDAYKKDREQRLTQFSRSSDIRVFTVAIGDEHGQGLAYVDRAALANIAKGANGGAGAYIELNSSTSSIQQSYLLSRLQQTLDDLRQSFRYSYSLSVRVGNVAQQDSKEHKLWIGFTVGDNPRIQLPVEYTFASVAAGPPVVKSVTVQPAIFIQSAPRTVKWQQLLVIYLALLTVFLVLVFIPAVGRRIAGGGQALKLHKSIVVVGNRSGLIGSPCPNEGGSSGSRYLIKQGDVVLICPNPRCKTPHHLSCWRFNEHHCMKRTCELEMIVPSKILEKYGLMEREVTTT